jgi:hypothetical protein
MYSSERNVCSIIYKKETNKWYYKVGKLLNLLDYGKLSIFCSSVGFNHGKDKVVDTKAYNFLLMKLVGCEMLMSMMILYRIIYHLIQL